MSFKNIRERDIPLFFALLLAASMTLFFMVSVNLAFIGLALIYVFQQLFVLKKIRQNDQASSFNGFFPSSRNYSI
nr:hypothetical protein [Aquiflexum lacus]